MSARHACATMLFAAALLPLPACAHAVLTGSSPTSGGVIAAGEQTITLHYNSRVDHGRSMLLLTRPDGGKTRLPIRRSGPQDELDTSADLKAPGAYTLRWQVLAVDGHITRGDVPFTVNAAPPAATRR